MSKKSEAKRSVFTANNHLGGAVCTKKQRRSHAYEFIEWCSRNGSPLLTMKDATLVQVNAYLVFRGLPPDPYQNIKDFESDFFNLHGRKPLSTATLHNILGSIRRVMRALKADPDKLEITVEKLGLRQKNRQGNKLPITDEIFAASIEAAILLGEIGFSIALKIERYLGHRGLEALMSPRELKKFAIEARAMTNRELQAVTVRDGTKGALVRQTVVIGKYEKETLVVIAEAMNYLSKHKFLVEGKKLGLKASRARYHALAKKVGLVGQFSPHSCRYRYATDKLVELRDAGVDRKKAVALCAGYLGHGPSRTQIISNVYGQTVVSTFPKTRRRRDYASAAAEINALIAENF